MATSIATPVSAPAAAPSAPAPAPAAAPVSAPSTPSTPSTPAAPSFNATLSMEDNIRTGWEAFANQPVEDPSAQAAAPAAPPAPTEDAAAATPAAETPAVDDELKLSLDSAEVLTAQQFDELLKNDPAALSNPESEVRHRVMDALRRDEENRAIQEFSPTVDIARENAQYASAMHEIDNSLTGATTREGAQKFLQTLAMQNIVRDAAGKPVLGSDGKYQVNPGLMTTFETIVNNNVAIGADGLTKGAGVPAAFNPLFNALGKRAESGKIPAAIHPVLDGLEKWAKSQNDERIQAVVDILREVTDARPPGLDAIPEQYAGPLKAERAALEQQRADAARTQQNQQNTANQQSIERAEGRVVTAIRSSLKDSFAASGLSEYEQDHATDVIGKQLDLALYGDPSNRAEYPGNALFLAKLVAITGTPDNPKPMTPASEKALAKHLITYTQQALPRIKASVLTAAKKGQLDRQQTRQDKVATQQTTSRTEPRGAATTSGAPQVQAAPEMRDTIIKEYQAAHNGEMPDNQTILKEQFRRFSTGGK